LHSKIAFEFKLIATGKNVGKKNTYLLSVVSVYKVHIYTNYIIDVLPCERAKDATTTKTKYLFALREQFHVSNISMDRRLFSFSNISDVFLLFTLPLLSGSLNI
jgi:hypothetical protein